MVKVLICNKMLFTFSTLLQIRHLWHLKIVIFLRRCVMGTVLLNSVYTVHKIASFLFL